MSTKKTTTSTPGGKKSTKKEEIEKTPEVVTPKDGVTDKLDEEAIVDAALLNENLAPGTGIDTDGDGDANFITAEEPGEVVPVPEAFDYSNTVRLSNQEFDVIKRKEAVRLVKESGVREHYKNQLLDLIKSNSITPQYANMLRKMRDADNQGHQYSGTLEG